MTGTTVGPLIPVRARSAVALALASAVGLVAFGWPFLTDPGSALDTSHSADAPWLFVLLLPLLAAIILAELSRGSLDAKTVALLGMLAAVGAGLRALGPGTAGLEPSFLVIILGGRVFGRGFGFVLGALTVFAARWSQAGSARGSRSRCWGRRGSAYSPVGCRDVLGEPNGWCWPAMQSSAALRTACC